MAAGERASGEPGASSAMCRGLLGKSHNPRVNLLVYKMGLAIFPFKVAVQMEGDKTHTRPCNSKVVTKTGSAT